MNNVQTKYQDIRNVQKCSHNRVKFSRRSKPDFDEIHFLMHLLGNHYHKFRFPMMKLLCPSICTNAGPGRIRYKGACFHYSGSVVALSLSSHGSRGEIPRILWSKRILHYLNDLFCLKCTQSLKEFQLFFVEIMLFSVGLVLSFLSWPVPSS